MICKYITTLIVSVLYVVTAFSQIQVKNERRFAGAALYGFMNGGADLYYEYGFSELVTREIEYKNEDFTVDVYTMDTPLNAFGIYSIHAWRCLRADSLGRFDCCSQYQLQAVHGDKYISIVFHSGSNAARKAADELYQMFATGENKEINIPAQIEKQNAALSGMLKYLKGKLGINNVQPLFEELIDGLEYFEIWYIDYAGASHNIALFVLHDKNDYNILKKRISEEIIIDSGVDYLIIRD